jgi:hypothetical protein
LINHIAQRRIFQSSVCGQDCCPPFSGASKFTLPEKIAIRHLKADLHYASDRDQTFQIF